MVITVHQHLANHLIQIGAFESDTKSIMEITKQVIDSADPNFNILWNSPSDEYGDNMYRLWYGHFLKPIAYDWMLINRPKAWFIETLKTSIPAPACYQEKL